MAIDHKTWAKMTHAERHASLLRDQQVLSEDLRRESYVLISDEERELLVKEAAGPLSRKDSKRLEWCQAILSQRKP